jgi:hypothetical protein
MVAFASKNSWRIGMRFPAIIDKHSCMPDQQLTAESGYAAKKQILDKTMRRI